MWDSFLVLLGLHPILATLLPISFGCLLLLLKKRRPLQVLGFVSLCLGIILGATLHFRWDSFSVHFSTPPNHSLPEKLSVLFVGDSITCEGSRPRGFITKIQSVLPIEHNIVCQKGATSIEILGLIEQASIQLAPTFIFAQSGINDLMSGSTQDQVFRSQEKLFEKLATKFHQAEVYFLPIHPLVNGEILELSPGNIGNFPIWWKDISSFVQDSLMADGVHLSAHGHTELALALIKEIQTSFSTKT